MLFDLDFVKKLKHGDKKSFEKLFLDLYPSLCEYSISITRSLEVSEGAVQDVFAAIWQKRDHIDDDVNIKAFLFRSVKNRSLDIVQHEKIRAKYQQEVTLMYNDPSVSTNDFSSSNLIPRVHEAVENLSEKDKVVYLLHHRDGLTYTEIAQVLDISVKAVEARMTKALKVIRQQLAKKKELNLTPLLIILIV